MQTKGRSGQLGLSTSVSIVVGSIIGAGIFMKPASMAAQTGSGWLLLLVWVVGGFLSLCGALIFAELGAMFPENGGLYVYLRKMYGDFIAYLYGWAALAVINTAAVASIAFVCAGYANYFLALPSFSTETAEKLVWSIPYIGRLYPLKDAGIKLLAIILVVLLTWLNVFSLKASGRLQVISTAAKILAIVVLVGGIILSGNGRLANLAMDATVEANPMDLLKGCMAALTGAFMAYDGWQNICFIGREVHHPQKNLPKSIVLGLLGCIGVYVLINFAYVYALPNAAMSQSALVAADAISAMLGPASGSVVAALIVLVTFGAINGNVMTTARVTMAMGEDRLFFAFTGKLSKTKNLPAHALWLHCGWIAVLIVSGSFDMLADMFVFVTWVFIIVACIGLVVLRKRMPDAKRPYRMKGYPWVLIVFALFACYYVFSVIQYEMDAYAEGKIPAIYSLLGLVVTFLGAPLYFILKRRYATRS
jgi:APA family basic amino acid/polyamine antiporter